MKIRSIVGIIFLMFCLFGCEKLQKQIKKQEKNTSVMVVENKILKTSCVDFVESYEEKTEKKTNWQKEKYWNKTFKEKEFYWNFSLENVNKTENHLYVVLSCTDNTKNLSKRFWLEVPLKEKPMYEKVFSVMKIGEKLTVKGKFNEFNLLYFNVKVIKIKKTQ